VTDVAGESEGNLAECLKISSELNSQMQWAGNSRKWCLCTVMCLPRESYKY